VPNDFEHATFRLSALQRSHVADATLTNLLSTLTSQIQTCARLAVFEYEAGSEGHTALASAFHELADVERASFTALLSHLRRHLDELPTEASRPLAHPTDRSTR
jgi:hypothetical protein